MADRNSMLSARLSDPDDDDDDDDEGDDDLFEYHSILSVTVDFWIWKFVRVPVGLGRALAKYLYSQKLYLTYGVTR